MPSLVTFLTASTGVFAIIALAVFVCSEDRGLHPETQQAVLAVGFAIAGIGLFTGVCALVTAISGAH